MRESRRSFFAVVPLIVLLLFAGLAPVGSALFNSFFHDVYGDRSFAGLDNYRYIFGDRGFAYSLTITIIWSVANVLFTLLFGFIFAVRLLKKHLLSSLFYLVLLIPWGIPVYIAVPLWRALIHGAGGSSLITTLTGLRINLLLNPLSSFVSALTVSVWLMVPLSTFVFLGALRKIPQHVTEAARIDGATETHIALSLYLPSIRGSLMVMGVLNFIKAFKEFTVIFLMTAGGPPLKSGITERSIVGATTTLEIFLYDVFRGIDDFGIPSAFAVVMGVLVLTVMTLWLMARKDKANAGTVRLVASISQIVFGGPLGVLWACGYLLSFKWRRLFLPVLLIQLIEVCTRVAVKGFLPGFSFGAGIALFCLYHLSREKSDVTRKTQSGIVRAPAVWLWRLFTPPVALLMVIACLLLLYLVSWMSLSRISACYVDTLLPRFISFTSFRDIFVEEGITRYFLNTLLVACCTGLLLPLLTFPAAAYLSGKRKAGTFLTVVQVIAITGGMHSLIPLYALFRGVGILDSYLPLVLVYISHSVPFSLFTMKAYLDSIPPSLRENARIEGISSPGYLIKILLPLSLPVIATSVMVAFLNGWNGFLVPLLFLNDDAKYTISIKLYSFIGSIASGNPRWNLFAAASIVNVALISLLFLPFKRPLQQTRLFEYGV